ncbi:hypothetical protein BCL76_12136 [Streptomyces sp. CG 926]|nr:hypothetical protein BCL76_12136 [Streptomyces sp. CG 926]
MAAPPGHTAPEVLTDRGNALGSVHRAIACEELIAAFCREHRTRMRRSAGQGFVVVQSGELGVDRDADERWCHPRFPGVRLRGRATVPA